MFMDFKQLPPSTCRPLLIALPEFRKMFRFSTLRENRRVVDGGAERQKQIEEYTFETDEEEDDQGADVAGDETRTGP